MLCAPAALAAAAAAARSPPPRPRVAAVAAASVPSNDGSSAGVCNLCLSCYEETQLTRGFFNCRYTHVWVKEIEEKLEAVERNSGAPRRVRMSQCGCGLPRWLSGDGADPPPRPAGKCSRYPLLWTSQMREAGRAAVELTTAAHARLTGAGWRIPGDFAGRSTLEMKDRLFDLMDRNGLGAMHPRRFAQFELTRLHASYPCILKKVLSEASLHVFVVTSAKHAKEVLCEHGVKGCQGSAVPRGWELQEMVLSRFEWASSVLARRGRVLRAHHEVTCLAKEWGVYALLPQQQKEARTGKSSRWNTPIWRFETVPVHVARTVPGFPAAEEMMGKVLAASRYTGMVNFNYKIRANGVPALFEMNPRITGDFKSWTTPEHMEATLASYATVAGCPYGQKDPMHVSPMVQRADNNSLTDSAKRLRAEKNKFLRAKRDPGPLLACSALLGSGANVLKYLKN